MSTVIILLVVRRTITLPDYLDQRIREVAGEHESFSAAISRLVAAGMTERQPLPYIGSADGELDDSLRVGKVVAEILDRHERSEREG